MKISIVVPCYNEEVALVFFSEGDRSGVTGTDAGCHI